MKIAVKAGLILAGIVTVLSLLISLSGLHRSSPLAAMFGAVLLFAIINVVMVWWSLSRSAGENGYRKQILNGLVLGLVGGVAILITSWLTMQFIFPDYLAEAGDAMLDAMAAGGASETQIDEQAEVFARTTPFSQALAGTVGTLGTSLVASLIIAIFKRKK